MPSHDGAPLLEARGLERSYGRVRILRGVDLSLDPGEVLTIIGPNGAGKTTLLRLLAGLIRPHAGTVRILGHSPVGGSAGVRSLIGLLSHQSLLYDDLTLLENLVFAARLHGLGRPLRVAAEALEASGLSDRGNDLPRRLSQGLLQRAAIARAFLHSPRVLLLDEPFTGLDSVAADRLRSDLRARLAQGAGLVVVTHHPAEIWDLTCRVAVLLQGRWAAVEPRTGPLENFLPRYRAMAGV
jgi:heme exporter protein A